MYSWIFILYFGLQSNVLSLSCAQVVRLWPLGALAAVFFPQISIIDGVAVGTGIFGKRRLKKLAKTQHSEN